MKKYLKISGIIGLFYIVFNIMIYLFGNWSNYKEIRLDDSISIKIERENGGTEKIHGNKFKQINTNDKLVVLLPLPENTDYTDTALCFTTYSSITKIMYEEQLLYSYGEELIQQGKFIGTVYDSVIIPQEALGKTIVMECIATEKGSMNQISNLLLMEATESSKYPVIGNLSELFFFLTIFAMSLLVFIILLFVEKKEYIIRLSIWLTLITSVMSLYILTSKGLLHPVVNDARVLTNLEYISIFFAPVPFALFFHDIYENKILKKVIKGLFFVCTVFFIACTVLNYTTLNFHYVYFLPYLHGEIILSILIYCVGIFIKTKNKEQEEWIVLVRSGVTILLIFTVIEIIRFNIAKNSESVLFQLKLLPMGVIIVLGVLILGIILKLLKRLQEIESQKQLEKMAYYDVLTGLETRVKCYSLIEKIKKDKIWEYTIFYIDLNDLKYYNDKFGHAMGDDYIKTMADIMRLSFTEADTISRFGGDEFVILYLKNIENEIEEYIQKFNQNIKEANENKRFPFGINAACGVMSSTEENPIEIEAAIAMADQKMYENKQKQKREKSYK